MISNIKIRKTTESGLSKVDFDNIPFGRVFSDHMFTADYIDGEWTNFEITPFGPFMVHPACLALHYGQAIFEGMKASVSHDGQPLLLRPEMHARRLNASAQRLCMPDFPEDVFIDALHALIDLDANWIPPQEGSALYIRPYMFANGEFIGVAPSDTYKFIIFTGPVGPYYPKPVRLVAEEYYVRAVKGGMGEAKAAGNYAGSLLPAQKAKAAGYDQILWLDGKEFKYIQEVGTMNIFFVIDGKVITPETDGAILKGITRDGFLTVLKDKNYDVEVRPITIDEIVEAFNAGKLTEIFGAGTAAVVAKVSDLTYRGIEMVLPPTDEHSVGTILKKEIDGLRAGKIEDKHGWLVPVRRTTEAT